MDYLWPLILSIRWQDMVDIALNSYILFRLYLLFKGTTAFRVLVGISLLWFSQRISVSLGLIVTSWAVQGITAVVAFIIIVVFRNEIRSVLQAKNLKALFWGFPHKSIHTPIEIIVDTVFEMALKQTGALMVFPGRKDIKEDAALKGVPWQGRVSKEMILSIFWPDNPVHDGAAVIVGNQITEVGVILPLSRRSDLPSYYGTRHRAALGLTEKTDAMVVLVSEERGEVVAAKDGRLFEIKEKDELSQRFREHVGSGKKTGQRRKETIERMAAAFVCVLFITGIWISFARGLYTLVTVEIPVEYMNRDPGMEIVETTVNAVRLDLSGSGPLIKSLRPDQIKVRLDLNNAGLGRNSFTISQENIFLPPGVVLKSVQPPVVEVTLDVPIKKQLPVQVDWVGKLPDHLILEQAKIDPEFIEVIGSGRLLQKISTLYTEKVFLDAIERSGEIRVNPALHPASLKISPGQPDKIVIDFVVKERG